MDEVAFAGINAWRGITCRKPFPTGKTEIRTGSILTGKMVIYPIFNNVDGGQPAHRLNGGDQARHL
jgi:hypothetical protein